MRSVAIKILPTKEMLYAENVCKTFCTTSSFILRWGSQFTFATEPYSLMTALISFYRSLNKQPTDLCFNGKHGITFSRKPPSEGKYVLGLPTAFRYCKQSKKTRHLCAMFTRLNVLRIIPLGLSLGT